MANQLFCVVFLNKYSKNLVVPSVWCSPFDLAHSVNYSLNRHTNRTIFYANDFAIQPKFGIGIAESFDKNVQSCHWGKIVKCFSEYICLLIIQCGWLSNIVNGTLLMLSNNFPDSSEEATEYCEARRSQMPAVYNPKTSDGRTTKQLHLVTHIEFDIAIATASNELIENAEIKIEGFLNEVSSLRKRCAYVQPHSDSIVDINESDIEDIQDDMDDGDSDIEFELLMPKPAKEEQPSDTECLVKDKVHQSASNNAIDCDMQTLNNSNVAGNSQDDVLEPIDVPQNSNRLANYEIQAINNQNISDESNNGQNKSINRNDVSPSSEQTIEDPFSGNFQFVQDVSIFYEIENK